MNSELLQGFIEQAEACLPLIRGGILISAQEGSVYGELSGALRQINALNESAAILNLHDIATVCGEFTRQLEFSAASKQPISGEHSRALLDKITEIEALITQKHFSLHDYFDEIADFVDESFKQLIIDRPPPPPSPAAVESREPFNAEPEESWHEEFEIDDEMLEIFAMEAEDLIRTINVNLEKLAGAPNDGEALLEIRRSAHTLKGSAGIIGLKKLSKAAHRVEDLLDYLADNEIESDDSIFELLLAASDCFAALANNEESPQLTDKIERIFASFDEKKKALENGKKNVDQIVSETEKASAGIEASAPDSVETALTQNQQNRSVVRVSLEKLDDLVKIVGGLVASRSVFEQHLEDFERHIGELHNSTRRLQSSTSKLETDFDSEMLGGESAVLLRHHTPEFKLLKANQNSEAACLSPASTVNFDSLEFDRYTEFHQTTRELVETTSDTTEISTELDSLQSNLEGLYDSQRRLIEEMQNKLLRLRMVSFGSLSIRLHRTVRVTCDEQGKSANLLIEGENLEIDTQILDVLVEPLLHLLRNAVAHGIEPPEMRRLLGKPENGKIFLRVVSEGTHIILTISDDGRGISAAALKDKAIQNGFITHEQAESMTDSEAFQLIFITGLTTAEKLSQISGRGVGMNIIKTSVERQQGTIAIESELQKGTIFTVRLPMALAVTRSLLVKAGEQTFAFPLNLVRQISEISSENLTKAGGNLYLSGTDYGVVHLNELLNLPSSNVGGSNSDSDGAVPLLLLETLEKPCALVVDEILKSEELVIKPLGFPLQNLADVLGATILGDGSVVPVLDLVYLIKNKDQRLKNRQKSLAAIETTAADPGARRSADKKLRVMIVDDSPSVRHLTSKLIKGAGWAPMLAKDGLEALEILQEAKNLPDIVLSDVEMPRMNGYELLSSLKRHESWQTIPVVMITSRAGDKHRQKAVELGVSEYLIKPFEDFVLTERIKALTTS